MSAGVKVYVVTFLFRGRQVLLIHRSKDKSFAPGLWTGVGGLVEWREMVNLQKSVFREVWEEAKIAKGEIRNLKLRTVLSKLEGKDIVLVVFFSGETDQEGISDCREGSLKWVEIDRVGELEMIRNARYVLTDTIRALEVDENEVSFKVCP